MLLLLLSAGLREKGGAWRDLSTTCGAVKRRLGEGREARAHLRREVIALGAQGSDSGFALFDAGMRLCLSDA